MKGNVNLKVALMTDQSTVLLGQVTSYPKSTQYPQKYR